MPSPENGGEIRWNRMYGWMLLINGLLILGFCLLTQLFNQH